MKRFTLLAVCFLLVRVSFAGGLLTNTNQSAQFIRMMSRNASTGIDAVYYNPAGLIKLEDGWHFAFSSQTIFQDKTVNSGFIFLNNPEYVGEIMVPVFPTVFGVYKMDKLAFSLGIGPNAGGGSADYATGLPSFEIPISKIVPGLAGLSQINPALSVTGYDAKLSFQGSSVFWGIQLGTTYEVNEIFSVYGGVRLLPSKNTYEGSIKDVQLEVGGQMYEAPQWLTQASTAVNGYATQASGAATAYNGAAANAQQLITAGAGSYTIAQVQNAGYISSAQRAQMEAALANLGLSSAQIAAMNITQVKTSYTNAAATYSGQAAVLTQTAGKLSQTAGRLGDKEVATEQTGMGFTPMIGINISPAENLNIALKYEMQTKLELKNNTSVDDLGLYPDGNTTRNDIPAVLTAGIGYQPAGWLEAQLSYTMFFDKNINWGPNVRDLATQTDPSKIRDREIDKNGFELGLGFQFNVSDVFAVSVGGLRSTSFVMDSYQSDFSYTNPSYTAGAGIMWKLNERLTLDAGVSNTFYEDVTVPFNDPDFGPYSDEMGKTTLSFAAGLSYSIF